jgi:hypothetical protein
VPDESTVRKLTRRIGAETVNELTKTLIEAAVRERRFRDRPPPTHTPNTNIHADSAEPTFSGAF